MGGLVLYSFLPISRVMEICLQCYMKIFFLHISFINMHLITLCRSFLLTDVVPAPITEERDCTPEIDSSFVEESLVDFSKG